MCGNGTLFVSLKLNLTRHIFPYFHQDHITVLAFDLKCKCLEISILPSHYRDQRPVSFRERSLLSFLQDIHCGAALLSDPGYWLCGIRYPRPWRDGPPWFTFTLWNSAHSLSGFSSGLFTQHLIKEESMIHTAAISIKLPSSPDYYLRLFLFNHTMSPSPFSLMCLEQQCADCTPRVHNCTLVQAIPKT